MINGTVQERPILFRGPMISALIGGRKTQTRRVIKPQPPVNHVHCPYGQAGDRLWVREAWRVASLPYDEQPAIQYRADEAIEWCDPFDSNFCEWETKYESWYERMTEQLVEDCKRAGLDPGPDSDMVYEWDWDSIPTRWHPSIYMPGWASRITLEIMDVRVERVGDISLQDVYAEGLPANVWPTECQFTWFRELWDSINAKQGYGWDVNPWVWVIAFRQ